jgi:hypothetical protein
MCNGKNGLHCFYPGKARNRPSFQGPLAHLWHRRSSRRLGKGAVGNLAKVQFPATDAAEGIDNVARKKKPYSVSMESDRLPCVGK